MCVWDCDYAAHNFSEELLKAMETEASLKYTLGFVWCCETDEVLLLNRLKAPWMGRWNGVGGKLDKGEPPLACIVRETEEETGLTLDTYEARGQLLWDSRNYTTPVFSAPQLMEVETSSEPTYVEVGGLYLFVAKVTKAQRDAYVTPRLLVEGILDWKPIAWITHPDNVGVVDNIRVFMTDILNGSANDVYQVTYRNNILINQTRTQN